MKPSEVLLAAKAKIETGWCRSAFAKTKDDQSCAAWRPEATKWCAAGAVMSVKHPNQEMGTERNLLHKVIGDHCWTSLGDWNDHPKRTQAEVLKAFDDAYQLALAEETKEIAQ